METKEQVKKQSAPLQLCRQGNLTLEKAQKAVNFVLTEMSKGKKLQSQMHSGSEEILFVFIANGLRATLHLQAFNSELIQEGGRV
ncbi:MAG: hypothetical protein LBN74_05845 [Prevotella sp.]|jgi:hypothetical protein|nr:hypothetical protein [Prevotella sp.]